MSVEAMEKPKARPVFGQITLDDMRGNELLTKTVMPLVKEVCSHSKGRFTVESVADGLISQRFSLWGVMHPPATLAAIIVTHVNGKVFELLLLGPELDDTFQFLPTLKSAARAARCERMLLTGPQFWRKRLPEGWRPTAMVYEFDVAH